MSVRIFCVLPGTKNLQCNVTVVLVEKTIFFSQKNTLPIENSGFVKTCNEPVHSGKNIPFSIILNKCWATDVNGFRHKTVNCRRHITWQGLMMKINCFVANL